MMKRNKKLWIIAGAIAIVLVIIIGGILYYNSQLKAVSKQKDEVIFEIKQGEPQPEILKSLEKENLIKNADMAKICLKLNGLSDMKYGIFKLDRSWDTKQILETLNDATKAKQNETMITFKEGMWAKDVALTLEKELGVSSKELISLWNDDAYLNTLIQKYPFLTKDILNENVRVKLESYLFPETYVFSKKATPEQITETFLDHFLTIYQKYEKDIKESGQSIHDIIKLASMVQYEASTKKDMELVAGVFYNRLKKGMKLESSVTVCYALYDDLTSGEDCEIQYNIDSPYNTYKNEGLPVGPILNPGEDAIAAVLHPEKSDYLYFVADIYGDGKVYYAKTYDEQLKNQEKFNLNK